MKKRGLASLLIVCIVAVAAVFGVVFAFQNSGRETDVYGSATITVDKPKINLEIELVKDETADNKFSLADIPASYDYFTIKVGGLPDSADRSAELIQSSINNGVVTVDRVTPVAEAGATLVTVYFLVKNRKKYKYL